MKCPNCGKQYPSKHCFSTASYCTECFNNLPKDEQKHLKAKVSEFHSHTSEGGNQYSTEQMEKVLLHVFDFIVALIIMIAVNTIGHNPGHVAVAAKEGSQIGILGYFVGWLDSRPILALIKANRRKI